jgi:hypothetical protein
LESLGVNTRRRYPSPQLKLGASRGGIGEK